MVNRLASTLHWWLRVLLADDTTSQSNLICQIIINSDFNLDNCRESYAFVDTTSERFVRFSVPFFKWRIFSNPSTGRQNESIQSESLNIFYYMTSISRVLASDDFRLEIILSLILRYSYCDSPYGWVSPLILELLSDRELKWIEPNISRFKWFQKWN